MGNTDARSPDRPQRPAIDGGPDAGSVSRAMGSPSRRAVRRTMTALAALATSVVLAGCGAGTIPTTPAPATDAAPAGSPASATPAPASNGVAPGTVVMIIRHGEKPEDDSTPGLDERGVEDNSSLTAVGWDRAHRLADLFDPAQGALRPGLARPTTIYAAGANEDGEGQRTRETVKPLADRLGLQVNTSYGKGDEEKLIEHVLSQPGPTLISWQHGEIPAIAEIFPSATPTPPSEWPDDRFDVVWTLTKTADGWHFAQLPELVLPQDQAGPIED
jgi:broad specificity phosphatase PhoE